MKDNFKKEIFKKYPKKGYVSNICACTFKRTKYAPWENGLLIETDLNFIIDKYGRIPDKMYNYKRQEYKFQLGELEFIFKDPEKPKNAAWLRELGFDWRTGEKFIKRESKKLKSIIL